MRHLGPVALLALAACTRPQPAPEVEYAGCDEWRAGPVCEVSDAPLVLWVPGVAPAALRFTLDGRDVAPATADAIQSGTRARLRVGPGELAVHVAGCAPWRLTVAAHTRDAALAEVARLRRGGQLAAAVAKLVEASAHPGAERERARNALAGGHVAEAIAAFERAIAEDGRRERNLALLEDRFALAITRIDNHFPYETIASELDAIEPLTRPYAATASDLEYVRTALARQYRDLRAGLVHARRVIAQAERLDLPDSAVDARQMLTDLLVFAGRWPDAARELSALRDAASADLPPCKAAQLWANIGWYRLVGHRHAPELFPTFPTEELDLAARLYATACPRPLSSANAEINRSWGSLFAGDIATARARWNDARARVADPAPRVQAHLIHLDAELALAEGRPADALAGFERLAEIAERTGALDALWQAAVGRGRALEASGRSEPALAAYREGERLLTALADRIPLGEGRDGLLFDRSIGAERGIAVAIASGHLDDAIAMVRQSRRGTLAWTRHVGEPVDKARLHAVLAARRALDEATRVAWALPADRLAEAGAARERDRARTTAALDALFSAPQTAPDRALPLAPDEAALFAHPVPGGLAIIVQRGDRRAAEVAPHTDRLPTLGPTAAPLRGARRVRVFADPRVEALDWMALALDGQPLYTRASAVFEADVGTATAAPSAPTAGRRALVLGDPARALPNAAREAAEVRDLLIARGWSVTWVREGDRAAIQRRLTAPLDLFHYSGHGVLAGADGLDSGIPLAEGQRLTVLDVLTATAVPRRAVLAACDLGQRGSRPGTPGLGLAQALLMAGADAVVAASRPVDDRATARWTARFYAHAAGGDWAEALRATTAELSPELDATAFRLWVAR